jgi:hypothetical protein
VQLLTRLFLSLMHDGRKSSSQRGRLLVADNRLRPGAAGRVSANRRAASNQPRLEQLQPKARRRRLLQQRQRHLRLALEQLLPVVRCKLLKLQVGLQQVAATRAAVALTVGSPAACAARRAVSTDAREGPLAVAGTAAVAHPRVGTRCVAAAVGGFCTLSCAMASLRHVCLLKQRSSRAVATAALPQLQAPLLLGRLRRAALAGLLRRRHRGQAKASRGRGREHHTAALGAAPAPRWMPRRGTRENRPCARQRGLLCARRGPRTAAAAIVRAAVALKQVLPRRGRLQRPRQQRRRRAEPRWRAPAAALRRCGGGGGGGSRCRGCCCSRRMPWHAGCCASKQSLLGQAPHLCRRIGGRERPHLSRGQQAHMGIGAHQAATHNACGFCSKIFALVKAGRTWQH